MRHVRYVRSRRKDKTPVLRLEPEKRLCPLFDPVTIAEFPVAEPGEMGHRVLANFCEAHIASPAARLKRRADLLALTRQTWYTIQKDSAKETFL